MKYTGQIMVYRYNGFNNAKEGMVRNLYTIKDISVETKEAFQSAITSSLTEVLPGKGYALVRWNERTFLCEKDTNNILTDYVRNEIFYHPLISVFRD